MQYKNMDIDKFPSFCEIIRIYHEFVDRIDNSVPKVTPEGQICQLYPQTYVGFFFLHTLGASA